jgi:drug/metabolite transporter (DMT)-like permease
VVFVVGIGAAVALALGWVLQQRMAARAAGSRPLSKALVLELMRQPLWWGGIAAMAFGQVLGGLALRLGSVSLVEALLSTYLLFAFIVSAMLVRWRPRWQELAGAALLSLALAGFVAVGNPRPHRSAAGWPAIVIAVLIILVVVAGLVGSARRRTAAAEAVPIATAAGLLYGLQDAATRGALQHIDTRGLADAFGTPWPYALVGAAAIGVVLSQSAFRAARLDYSLPPAAVAEPLCGVGLGIALLGDRLSAGAGPLAVEALCALAMIAAAVVIGRSPLLVTHVRASNQAQPPPEADQAA